MTGNLEKRVRHGLKEGTAPGAGMLSPGQNLFLSLLGMELPGTEVLVWEGGVRGFTGCLSASTFSSKGDSQSLTFDVLLLPFPHLISMLAS